MHKEEDDFQRITTAWRRPLVESDRFHADLQKKAAAAQIQRGDSNRQLRILKPTALTRPGWKRPHGAAAAAGTDSSAARPPVFINTLLHSIWWELVTAAR